MTSIVRDGPCHRCGKRGTQWLIGVNCSTEPQEEFAWCSAACAAADGAWPPTILHPELPAPARPSSSRKPTREQAMPA